LFSPPYPCLTTLLRGNPSEFLDYTYIVTSKLSYRKDDRAMRPIVGLYSLGAVKIFERPWVRPRLLFRKF